MKKTLLFLVFLLCFVTIAHSQVTDSDSAFSYLGQAKPNAVPKSFSLSVSSGYFASERIAISNDGKEIYYSELNGYGASSKMRIKYYSYSEGKWSGPKILFENFFSPTLSVDGKKMFMQKINNSSQEVWYSIKSDSGWNTPSKFMPNHGLDYMVWETDSGNLYFGSMSAKGGLGQLDWSELVIKGNDSSVQSLGAPLCTSDKDVDFSISRNDSVIIIASGSSTNRKASGILDLFVSYKKMNNTWTNPKNLGPTININDKNDGRWAPCFTADNKYLFYTSGWNGPSIHWVRIDSLIDRLKKTNYSPYIMNKISNQSDSLGRTFNFTVPDSIFFDDDGNNTLSYSAFLNNKPLPTWLAFNPESKTFSGTLDSTGKFTIMVTATDTAKASISTTFTLIVSGPTYIKQTLEQRIQVYPNPTKDKINISFGSKTNKNSTVEITNISGKLIQTNNIHNNTSSTIDLSGYPKGIYIVSIIADGEKINKKVCLE